MSNRSNSPRMLYHVGLSVEALRGLITQVPYAYVESHVRCELLNSADVNLQTDVVGRAFGPDREFRWMAGHDGTYISYLLTETDDIPAGFETYNQYDELPEGAEYPIKLWGLPWPKKNPTTWVEARIPRYLDYPVTQRGEVWVWAIDYRLNGMVQVTRWMGFAREGTDA